MHFFTFLFFFFLKHSNTNCLIVFSSSLHYQTQCWTLVVCLFVRFRHQAAAVRSSSEVRGQTGSPGDAGDKVQGNSEKCDRIVNDCHRNTLTDVSQVNNMFDEVHPARDFHNVVKQSIDDMMGREVTFDILFHNSEHQATLFRYGVKKSEQVSRQTMLFHWYQLVFLLKSVSSVVLNQVSSLTFPRKTWATANQTRAF